MHLQGRQVSAPAVALVIPPGEPGTTPNREGASGMGAVEPPPGGFRYPPHTTATAGAVLRLKGLQVSAVDAPAVGLSASDAVAAAISGRPDAIGVQVSWATRSADEHFLRTLRRSAPSVPVVAYGVSTRWMLSHLTEADAVLEGEPELSLAALCVRLIEGNVPPGPITAPEALAIEGYAPEGWIADLDALPAPAWDLLPTDRYPRLSVLSSRGCTHQCRWCPYTTAQGHTLRSHSARHIVDEILALADVDKMRRVIFRDPAFAADGERVRKLCGLLIDEDRLCPGRSFTWECESRPDHFDSDTLRLMGMAGCVGIKVGLETSDVDLLMAERRVASKEAAQEYLSSLEWLSRMCGRLGIACRIYVMAGLPGMTLDAARETARFVTRLPSASLTVKTYKPYPGLDPATGVIPPEDSVAAQVAVLREAARALEAAPRPRPSRWVRVWHRLSYRMGARTRGGRN